MKDEIRFKYQGVDVTISPGFYQFQAEFHKNGKFICSGNAGLTIEEAKRRSKLHVDRLPK